MHDLIIQMAYALGIGLLIGLERSMIRSLDDGKVGEPGDQDAKIPDEEDEAAQTQLRLAQIREGDFLGMRTFSVISLVGFSAALAGERLPYLAPVALAGVCVVVVAMYFRATDHGTGVTTEIAAIGTCLLGMLCHENSHAAGVLALIFTVLLAAKRFTRETVRKMRWVELTDTLKFLVVILIVLPLLPDKAIDPYGAFNPYKVGFLVVLISGISFVGYFLTRILGAQKGLGLTGILGGLTSSTAVTAAMAADAREHPELRAICAFSTIAANATMFVRVLVVVAVLDRTLALRLAWPIGSMSLAAIIAAGVLWLQAGKRDDNSQPGELPLKNPFSLGPAIKFGLFFVAILFVAKLATLYLGNQGLYMAAALSGLADVDAITLTIAEQTKAATLMHQVGAVGIIIAVVSNSVVKTAIAIYSGGWLFGRVVGVCLGLATAVGLVVVLLV